MEAARRKGGKDKTRLWGDKRGGAYVEASMTLPLACLIMAALMGIVTSFYDSVAQTAAEHVEEAENWDVSGQIEAVRRYGGWFI